MDPFLGNTSCQICDEVAWAQAVQEVALKQGRVCINTDELVRKSLMLQNGIWILLVMNAILFLCVYMDWKKILGTHDIKLFGDWWGYDFYLSQAIPMMAFLLGFMLNAMFGVMNWLIRGL